MKCQFKYFLLSILLIFIALIAATAGDSYGVSNHLWKPVADDVYLQEVAGKVITGTPVTSLSFYEARCYAIMDGRIYTLKDAALSALKAAPEDAKRLEFSSFTLLRS